MTTLITRFNGTPGEVPTDGDAAVGELLVNVADGTLFTSSNGTDIVPISGYWKEGDVADTIVNTNTSFVGVNTPEPTKQLHITGDTLVEAAPATVANLELYRPDEIVQDTIFARVSGKGIDSTLDTNRVGARIDMVGEGTWTDTVTPSSMRFVTGRAGSNIVEAGRFDETGCLLIGLDDNGGYTTNSNNTSLVVANGNITDIQASSAANEFVINSATNSGMSILTGTTSIGTIAFGRDGDADAGRIEYNHNTKEMHFSTDTGSVLELWDNLGGTGNQGLLIGASIYPPNSGWTFDETGYSISAKDGAGTTQTGHFDFYNATVFQGNITTTNTRVYYNTTSDYRLKENVVPMTGALDDLLRMKPVSFNFKSDPNLTVDGFIAHEVAEVVPYAVGGEKDGEKMQTLDASVLIPMLVAAVQELTIKVEELS